MVRPSGDAGRARDVKAALLGQGEFDGATERAAVFQGRTLKRGRNGFQPDARVLGNDRQQVRDDRGARGIVAPDAGAGRDESVVDLVGLEELVPHLVELAVPIENVIQVKPRAEHIGKRHAGLSQAVLHEAQSLRRLPGAGAAAVGRPETAQDAIARPVVLEHRPQRAAAHLQGMDFDSGDGMDLYAGDGCAVTITVFDPGHRPFRAVQSVGPASVGVGAPGSHAKDILTDDAESRVVREVIIKPLKQGGGILGAQRGEVDERFAELVVRQADDLQGVVDRYRLRMLHGVANASATALMWRSVPPLLP